MTDALFDIRGKIALVTGGTSGIGLMIARALVKRGVKTYVSSRNAADAAEVAARLSSEGECVGLGADLADAQGPHAPPEPVSLRERMIALTSLRTVTLDLAVRILRASAGGFDTSDSPRIGAARRVHHWI